MKRPIDIQRDSGGIFRIESRNEETPIEEIFELNGGIILVTQKAIYEVKMADQIDPKRENPNLPLNVQRRLLEFGSDSELVGRVLLTAKNLFRKEFLPASVDTKQALALSYECLLDVVAMHTTFVEYEALEKKEIEAFAQRLKGKSFTIPSVADVKIRCKTFFQKADQVEQTIWDIVRLFYPEVQNKCNYESFRDFVKNKYGIDNDFTKFMNEVAPFLKMVRNARDCLDHRNAGGVEVTNFVLSSDGNISRPAISIKFRGTNQPPVSISYFLPWIIGIMLDFFENLIAYLCDSLAKAFAGFQMQIGIIPDAQRRNKHVQYSFGVFMNENFCPMG